MALKGILKKTRGPSPRRASAVVARLPGRKPGACVPAPLEAAAVFPINNPAKDGPQRRRPELWRAFAQSKETQPRHRFHAPVHTKAAAGEKQEKLVLPLQLAGPAARLQNVAGKPRGLVKLKAAAAANSSAQRVRRPALSPTRPENSGQPTRRAPTAQGQQSDLKQRTSSPRVILSCLCCGGLLSSTQGRDPARKPATEGKRLLQCNKCGLVSAVAA